MAETSRFFTTNGVGDGVTGGYDAVLFQAFVRGVMQKMASAESVLRKTGGELAVTGTGTPVSVAAGSALVYGLFYENDTALSVAVSTPVGGTRLDLVVLRANMTSTASGGTPAQSVRVALRQGTPGGPLPTLTQNASIWEVSLAQLSVTTGGVITVTDLRNFVQSPGSAYADGTTLEQIGNLLRVKDDSIDDTKLGDRAPQLYRRQGSNGTDWATGGTNNYTPGKIRIQCGAISEIGGGGGVGTNFPVAFSGVPIMFVTPNISCKCWVGSLTAANYLIFNDATSTVTLYWMAIGPE